MRLDVLFVIPNGRAPGAYGPVAKGATEPPAAARFSAAYLMRRNCSVNLFDTNVSDAAPDQVAFDVRSLNPHLVVIPVYGFNPSSSTQTMPSARTFAVCIKEVAPEIPIMFMGTHPAALPKQTLLEEPIDYVCSGEGPVTIHQLLQALKAGSDVSRVPSLWYRKDGGACTRCPRRSLTLTKNPRFPGGSLWIPGRTARTTGTHSIAIIPIAARMPIRTRRRDVLSIATSATSRRRSGKGTSCA